MEFADGQSVTTISITVRDDGIPEQDETSLITLTTILEGGTSLRDRAAVIGAQKPLIGYLSTSLLSPKYSCLKRFSNINLRCSISH